ncbi:MAG: acyloxyacyl hydrolase [Bacteroidales bacterium]|jgi:hypothetical protein|nr:acyloxyacyl hydrolase [Bacteroidales bacterium]
MKNQINILIVGLILLLLFTNITYAQKFKGQDVFIEGGISYGTTLYHPSGTIYLKDFYYPRLEVRFGKQTSGKNRWEQMLNFPSYGVALRYTTFWDFMDTKSEWKERNKVMGQSIAFFGYFKGTFVRYKWFSWNYQLGMGAVYFTKIYNKEVYYKPDNSIVDNYQNRIDHGMSVEGLTPDFSNPDNYLYPDKEGIWNSDPYTAERNHNCLISLYVTPYINFQTGFDFQLSKQVDLSLQATFTHASNASMNMPNYGINELHGVLSILYHFNPKQELVKRRDYEKHKAVNSLFFTIDPGWLLARYDDNYYLKTGMSVGYMRNVLPVLNVGIALEAAYVRYLGASEDHDAEAWSNVLKNPDEAIAAGIDPKNPTARIEMPKNLHNEAIYAFAELLFGRFSFQVGVGAYFNKGPQQAKYMDLAQNWDGGGTLKSYPWIYEKVGFRVYLGKNHHHFVGAAIRAHFPVADYLAFTYGFKFFNFDDIKRNKSGK